MPYYAIIDNEKKRITDIDYDSVKVDDVWYWDDELEIIKESSIDLQSQPETIPLQAP